MLRANVGLSRKISHNYQSNGYSINLDGEISAAVDDPEQIVGRVQELFDLAQEALNQEIDRSQGDFAIGSRDEEPQGSRPEPSSNGNSQKERHRSSRSDSAGNTHSERADEEDAATNKQIQFIQTLGKRFKLSNQQMESRIARITGRSCGVYDLTKREAGQVLDEFTKGSNRRRSA